MMNKKNDSKTSQQNMCCTDAISQEILKSCCKELLSDCCETLAKKSDSKTCCSEGLNKDKLKANCVDSLSKCYTRRLVQKCKEKSNEACCTSEAEMESIKTCFENFIDKCFERISLDEGSAQCGGGVLTAEELKKTSSELMASCFPNMDCNDNSCCKDASKESSPQSCDCSSSDSDKSDTKESKTEENPMPVNISIDGISAVVTDDSKNIVEIAKEMNISIPAPCFYARRKKGCCNACVIEVDGKQAFACVTKAKNGMKITVDREDLKALRKERLLAYQKGIKTGTSNKCSCS